jgi:hypothetical protein
MTIRKFSFGVRAKTFDAHIDDSIPGFQSLVTQIVALSPRFV